MAQLTSAQFFTKWVPLFGDNDFQNIDGPRYEAFLTDLRDSYPSLSALNVRQVKGATYPVPYTDSLGTIPAAYRIVGMQALARDGQTAAEAKRRAPQPPVTFELVASAGGDVAALLDEQPGTTATRPALWVQVSGSSQQITDSFPDFVAQNADGSPHPYATGDKFKYQFGNGLARLFEVRASQHLPVNPAPTGQDDDPRYRPFAPLQAAYGLLARSYQTLQQAQDLRDNSRVSPGQPYVIDFSLDATGYPQLILVDGGEDSDNFCRIGELVIDGVSGGLVTVNVGAGTYAKLTVDGYTDAQIDALLTGKQGALIRQVQLTASGNTLQLNPIFFGRSVTIDTVTASTIVKLPPAGAADVGKIIQLVGGYGPGAEHKQVATGLQGESFPYDIGERLTLEVVSGVDGSNNAVIKYIVLGYVRNLQDVSGKADVAALAQLNAQIFGRNRGGWAASTAYLKYDFVTYNGTQYYANAAFTSGASFDVNNWTQGQYGQVSNVTLGSKTTTGSIRLGRGIRQQVPGASSVIAELPAYTSDIATIYDGQQEALPTFGFTYGYTDYPSCTVNNGTYVQVGDLLVIRNESVSKPLLIYPQSADWLINGASNLSLEAQGWIKLKYTLTQYVVVERGTLNAPGTSSGGGATTPTGSGGPTYTAGAGIDLSGNVISLKAGQPSGTVLTFRNLLGNCYPAIASGTFTVDPTGAVPTATAFVRLEAGASKPSLPAPSSPPVAGDFVRLSGSFADGYANVYSFAVLGGGVIYYYINQP